MKSKFIKILVSILLVILIFRGIEYDAVLERLLHANIQMLISATAILLLLSILHTQRWLIVIKACHEKFAFLEGLKNVLVGYFFSQALPSSVGGDVVRVWRTHKTGIKLSVAFNSVFLDRIGALVGLLLMILVSLPWVFDVVREPVIRAVIYTALIMGFGGIVALLMLERLPEVLARWRWIKAVLHLSGHAKRVLLQPSVVSRVAFLSIAVHLAVAGIVYLVARSVQIEVSFLNCVLLVPPVMLITMLPISVAGWGVRESAMIFMFGFISIPAEDALSVSLLFGMATLVASLPGGVIWLLCRKSESHS